MEDILQGADMPGVQAFPSSYTEFLSPLPFCDDGASFGPHTNTMTDVGSGIASWDYLCAPGCLDDPVNRYELTSGGLCATKSPKELKLSPPDDRNSTLMPADVAQTTSDIGRYSVTDAHVFDSDSCADFELFTYDSALKQLSGCPEEATERQNQHILGEGLNIVDSCAEFPGGDNQAAISSNAQNLVLSDLGARSLPEQSQARVHDKAVCGEEDASEGDYVNIRAESRDPLSLGESYRTGISDDSWIASSSTTHSSRGHSLCLIDDCAPNKRSLGKVTQKPPTTIGITLDNLKEVFHLHRPEAERRLNLKRTTFSNLSRHYGISKWPFRTLRDADKRMRHNGELLRKPSTSPDKRRKLLVQQRRLNAVKALMYEEPYQSKDSNTLSVLLNLVAERERVCRSQGA